VHGRIDILVNNAGVTYAADLLDLPVEAFDNVLSINLRRLHCQPAAARHMVAAKSAPHQHVVGQCHPGDPKPDSLADVEGRDHQITKVLSAVACPAQHPRQRIGPGHVLTIWRAAS